MHIKHRLIAGWPLILAALFVGGFLGWFIPSPISTTVIQSFRGTLLRENDSTYSYIAPLLACDIGSEQAFPEFAPLKSTLASLVNAKIKSGAADHISIYVRSLKGARWVEVGGDETYAPASLLKVFVMMAYYKEAEDTDSPALLQKQISFESSQNPAQDTPGEIIPHLQNKKLYTIEQVINQMIIYSDNDALNTLVDNFDPETLNDFQGIFTDLNIPSPVTQSENSLNFMTVTDYSLVFRVLFSSTYLSNRYSEQAIALLAKAQYKAGIVAGVPSNFTVAHKFGVTTVPATANTLALNELHDCGIVYYPNHPYLLCVMTEGNNFGQLQQTIKDISGASYSWLDTFYKNLPSSTASTTPSDVRP